MVGEDMAKLIPILNEARVPEKLQQAITDSGLNSIEKFVKAIPSDASLKQFLFELAQAMGKDKLSPAEQAAVRSAHKMAGEEMAANLICILNEAEVPKELQQAITDSGLNNIKEFVTAILSDGSLEQFFDKLAMRVSKDKLSRAEQAAVRIAYEAACSRHNHAEKRKAAEPADNESPGDSDPPLLTTGLLTWSSEFNNTQPLLSQNLSTWSTDIAKSWFKDCTSTATNKLEYCMLNLKAQENNFPHNSLVWIPFDSNLKWRPARLKWKTPLPVLGCSFRLPFVVNSELHLELDTSMGYRNDEKQFDKLVCDKVKNKKPEEITKLIMEETYKFAGEAWDKSLQEQQKHIAENNWHQEERLNGAFSILARDLQTFAPEQEQDSWVDREERTKSQAQRICTHRPNASSNCIGETDKSIPAPGALVRRRQAIHDVKCGLGKSADKTYESPGYEDAYLLVHGIGYSVLFFFTFCGMLAINSYGLMQFFFLFLVRDQFVVHMHWQYQFQYFVYFFAIPWVLVALSLIGFEVSGLIRSSVATPQMSRPRALLVGLCMCGRPSWRDRFKISWREWHNTTKPEFWNDLNKAMSWVDSWFTIAFDGFMVVGASLVVLYSHVNQLENFPLSIKTYATNFCIAFGITVIAQWVFLWMSDHEAANRQEDCCWNLIHKKGISGRMLHWDGPKTRRVVAIFFLSAFLALCNSKVAYEGMVLGGCVWAIVTMLLFTMADMLLSPHQRFLMTTLETCLQDRCVKPGHMTVRSYDITNNLKQQLTLHKQANQSPSMTPSVTKPSGNGCRFSSTLLYFLSANGLWFCTYLLSWWGRLWSDTADGFLMHLVVFIVAFLLLFLTQSSVLSVLIGLGYVLLLIFGKIDENLAKTLEAAGPALLLLPVMLCWHHVLVRRIPSISRGSTKESSSPTLFHFNAYRGFVILYSFGSVLFFIAGSLSLPQPMHEKDVQEMRMSVDPAASQSRNVTSDMEYPVCRMKWGAPGLDLGIIDMAILAKYAYALNKKVFQAGIDASFNGLAGFNVTHVERFDHFDKLPRMTATKFTSGTGQTTIALAVKGTSTPSEAFADMSLYSGVAILGFLSQFVDIFDLMPNTLIGFLLNHLRLPLVKALENRMIMRAANITMGLKQSNPNAHIVITGHSLGGGIAGAVGSITNVEAITFSAPGSHFNRFVFHNNFERYWRNWVNIWPESDVVPSVDRHDEMVQRIACKDPQNGAQMDPGTCHLVTTTICELWRVCGDPRNRKMALCTDAGYDERTWGKYIRPTRPHQGVVKPDLPTDMKDLSYSDPKPSIINDIIFDSLIVFFALILVISFTCLAKESCPADEDGTAEDGTVEDGIAQDDSQGLRFHSCRDSRG